VQVPAAAAAVTGRAVTVTVKTVPSFIIALQILQQQLWQRVYAVLVPLHAWLLLVLVLLCQVEQHRGGGYA
jgi:hypothetical protein